MKDHVSEVRRYYEANTSLFARLGQGSGLGTIRRAIWGPGVHSRAESFHFGGDALQRGLLDGLIAHRFLVYRRQPYRRTTAAGD